MTEGVCASSEMTRQYCYASWAKNSESRRRKMHQMAYDSQAVFETQKGQSMKKEQCYETKPSEPDKVDAYMKKLKHPLAEVAEALRKIISSTDSEIGEEIKWNAPAFFYAGEMKPSDPKKYKRYIVVFNLDQKDCIRLVFPSGAKIKDSSGLLQGDYADGRRLAFFHLSRAVKSLC